MLFKSCFVCQQGDACATPHTPFRNHGLKFIDNAYHSLPKEEQERIHRDLYGIEEPIDETPEFLDNKLRELDKELSGLNNATRKAYILATKGFQNDNYGCSREDSNDKVENNVNNYVSSRKFRLIFLRAESFDARKAAARLARYLTEKRDLFGDEALPRRITLDDLYRETDQKALFSGFCCITGESDTAGRLVGYFRREAFFGLDVDSMLRVLFYLFQLAVENNEDVQKNGFVAFCYNIGSQLTVWASNFRYYMPVFRHFAHGMPIRTAAAHLVYNDIKEHILVNLSVVAFTDDLRSRHHCHFIRTHEDCECLLILLGIEASTLPFKEDGSFRAELLWQHLAKDIAERQHNSSKICTCEGEGEHEIGNCDGEETLPQLRDESEP